MDLGSSTLAKGGQDGRSTAELLDDIADTVQWRRKAELKEFRDVIAWADANTVETLEGAATIRDSLVDTGLPLAGPGAPLVSEYALMELCATLERSLDSGREHVGKIIEVAWRLPTIREQVYAGRVPIWKALRVADLTRPLSAAAAAFVDRNLGFALPTCTWTQIDRLVSEAIDRHDPDTAEERRRKAADTRHVRTTEGADGIGYLDATLDLADLHDIESAVARRAKALGQFGCEESLDVRRALALGELARHDLTLDLETVDEATGEITRVATGRKVELNVHLTDAALAGTGTSTGLVGSGGSRSVSNRSANGAAWRAPRSSCGP